MLTHYTKQVFNYLDIEAIIDNGGEEEILDNKFSESLEFRSHLLITHIGCFFEDDNNQINSMLEWDLRPSSPMIDNSTQEAEEMQALVTCRHIRPSLYALLDILKDEVPQNLLVPRDFDFPLWAIHVKVSYISVCMYGGLTLSRWDLKPVLCIKYTTG
jgi:hypothetical protein